MAKELNYKEIGLRIKTLRLKNNIYQTVLAKEIGEEEAKQEQGVDVLKNCTMQDIIQAMQMLKSLKG